MRITKDPEERRQEIIETAMHLFYEKGYEKTSIGDIAKAIGVAQGLCYRYFPSKEALFDSTVDQYAQILADRLSLPAEKEVSLRQILENMPVDAETDDTDFYKVFHKADNKKFHDQLSMKVCEKLLPTVTKLLERAQSNGCLLYTSLYNTVILDSRVVGFSSLKEFDPADNYATYGLML